MDNIFHYMLNYTDILLGNFQIKIYFINFCQKVRIYAFFVFSVTMFWGSQIIPKI